MIALHELISPAYLQTQVALHAGPKGYGETGARWAETVRHLAERDDCWSVLDYGCGQGTLAQALRGARFAMREYDPAIAGKDHPPSFADLVVCADVLEHVEPDRLSGVLAHLRALARKRIFLVVSTRPARHRLADGRNAHLIVESPEWWDARVREAGCRLADPPTVWPAKCPRRAWIAVVRP